MDQPDIRRYRAAIAEMKAAGLRTWGIGAERPSLIVRLITRGRPAPYLPFAPLAVNMGVYFAVTWGLTMWLMVWRDRDVIWPIVLVACAAAGCFFGLAMAGLTTAQARRHKLSRWEDL